MYESLSIEGTQWNLNYICQSPGDDYVHMNFIVPHDECAGSR